MRRLLLLGLVLVILVLTAAPAFPQARERRCIYLDGRIIHWGYRVFYYSSLGPQPNISLMETAGAMQSAYMDAYINEGCFGEV